MLFFLAVAALCATDLRAQAAAAPLLLRLERGDTLGPGSIAVAEGTASTSPVRFRIERVDVAQPITVAAAGGSASRPLTVSVSKDVWESPQSTAVTGADGTATLQFRTHGDFGIAVNAPAEQRIPFTLAVWVGTAAAEEPAGFLVPVAEYTKVAQGGAVAALPASTSLTAADGSRSSSAASSDPTSRLSSSTRLLAAAVASAGVVLAAALLIKRPTGGQ